LSIHPRLTYMQDVAQKFLLQKSKKDSFDILVNDMRMDMIESCKIMLDMAPFLSPNGIAVMTLKLPHSNWYKNTARALALLEKSYAIKGARQLFHNRSEVTVVMSYKHPYPNGS